MRAVTASLTFVAILFLAGGAGAGIVPLVNDRRIRRMWNRDAGPI